MSPWLHVIGIGADGLDGLSSAARRLVAGADVLVGGARHLALVEVAPQQECLQWPSPFSALTDELRARSDRTVCVLASGDPLVFGVGNVLSAHFDRTEMTVVPAPSAFALARAKLGWNADGLDYLTLHGRPLAQLQTFVQPGARLLILTTDDSGPRAIAAALTARGFGPSELTVMEQLGAEGERVRACRADAFAFDDIATLNTVAVRCVASAGADVLTCLPGLPDDAFRHDGQLTKRIVRAATVSALGPLPGALLWDVGAGCGSVAIEWLRAVRGTRAIAVERHPDRLQMMSDNAEALGTPQLRIAAGSAPAALHDLPQPDAIFVGGAASDASVLDVCWDALPAGGRLVANAVTIQGETELARRYDRLGGELQRIAVASARPVGRFAAFDPAMSVTQLVVTKPYS
ncbi:MAG: precorrin-6y C5,15-methyltransferase (decarboxylating) subunit CbiE [Pseudomonadota bacterium]